MNGRKKSREPRGAEFKIRLRDSEKAAYERVALELDIPVSQWMRAILNKAVEDFDKRAK